MFKNVHFRKFQFVFLRVKLKSEVYLTSSRFSLFSEFFMLTLLLLRTPKENSSKQNLVISKKSLEGRQKSDKLARTSQSLF